MMAWKVRRPGRPAPAPRRAAPGLALVVVALVAGCTRGEQPKAGPTPVPPVPTEVATVSLIFPGHDSLLHAESRDLALPLAPDGRVEAVVTALLAGPRMSGLVAPLPEGVTVADAFVDAQGVAYVDLAAKDQPAPPASGSELELLRVYSLVNTVLANEPRAHSVVLLWNGVQRLTFAGHVDTAAPLLADGKLVR